MESLLRQLLPTGQAAEATGGQLLWNLNTPGEELCSPLSLSLEELPIFTHLPPLPKGAHLTSTSSLLSLWPGNEEPPAPLGLLSLINLQWLPLEGS